MLGPSSWRIGRTRALRGGAGGTRTGGGHGQSAKTRGRFALVGAGGCIQPTKSRFAFISSVANTDEIRDLLEYYRRIHNALSFYDRSQYTE